jgi:transposase-like protein
MDTSGERRAGHEPWPRGSGRTSVDALAGLARLGDEDACLDHLRDLLFPSGSACPRCARATRFHRVRGRQAYACQYCGHHVHPAAGTVFRRSRVGLCSWFGAVALVASDSDRVGVRDLARLLGVSRRTASGMLVRIRELPRDGTGIDLAASPRARVTGASGRPTAPADPASQSARTLPELLREELLAGLPALRDDLRAAERSAREAQEAVAELRATVRTVERLTGASAGEGS